MHPDLERLTRLSDLDMELMKARHTLAEARAAVSEGEKVVREAEAARDTVKVELERVKDAERATHRELEQYRRRLKRAEHALEHGMGDPAAAERQREQCTAIIDKLETDLLEAYETTEEVQPRLAQAQAVVDRAQAALEQVRAEAPERIATARARVAHLVEQRDSEYEPLPRDLQGRYDLLIGRKPPPVARIRQGACKKCQYTVPQQKLLDIGQDKIIECRGCGRWLVPE